MRGATMARRLTQAGAPKDFSYHTVRHTVATHMQNMGRAEWEVAQVLNHSSGSVTAGYSHGVALELKRKLLQEWAAHIETIISPKGARVLR